MFRVLLLAIALPGPVLAGGCTSLVKSMCPGAAAEAEAPTDKTGRRVLKVEVRPPAFAVGNHFPVENHSLLMNPTRYGLEGSDGTWRYYALDGTVYKVDNTTSQIIEVIRDSRTWGLR